MPGSERRGGERGPRFLSLGVKLALGVTAVVSLVSVVAFFELTSRERERSVAQKAVAARMVADLVASTVVAPLDFGDDDALDKELSHLAGNRDVVGAAVFGPTGLPLAAWPKGVVLGAPAADDLAGFDDRLEVGRLVRNPSGKVVGSLRVVLSLGPENAAFAGARRRIAVLALVMALATATLILLVTRRVVLGPLSRMARAAARIGEGERGVTVRQPTADELGLLAGAMNTMSASIVAREEELAATTRSRQELLDHMRQAIVVSDGDGVVQEVSSAAAREIFGEARGRRLVELLYPGQPGDAVEVVAFEEWCSAAIGAGGAEFEELRALAPARAVVGARHLALDFRPLDRDGVVEKVMLLAIDETDRHRLEEDLRQQEEAHGRERRAMRRLLSGSGAAFVHFVETAGARLETCARLLASGRPTAAELDEVYRVAHTVKGEALAYELESVAAEVHAVEDVLDQVGRGRSGDWDESVKAVAAAVERARVALEEARALMVRASPLGAAVLDQVSVRRSELDALVALTLGDRAADRDGAVARVVRRLTARPFGEAAGLLAERAAGWAASVGKRVALEVRGGEQPVPADVAARLPGLLAQLVRNAVVHGIELPEVRRALGKDPAGTIVASCASDGEIVVADDGAGLADDDEPRSRPADLLAGRGIGLRAVRSLAMEVGRMLIVESDPGRGARFRLVPTARSLPPPAEGPEERA